MTMENIPNSFPDLFIGYAILWGCILLFMFRLAAKLRGIQQRLRELDATKVGK